MSAPAVRRLRVCETVATVWLQDTSRAQWLDPFVKVAGWAGQQYALFQVPFGSIEPPSGESFSIRPRQNDPSPFVDNFQIAGDSGVGDLQSTLVRKEGSVCHNCRGPCLTRRPSTVRAPPSPATAVGLSGPTGRPKTAREDMGHDCSHCRQGGCRPRVRIGDFRLRPTRTGSILVSLNKSQPTVNPLITGDMNHHAN